MQQSEVRACDCCTPGSGSRLAGSPAWHGLPQCPGYGHWVSYCCMAFVFGSGLCSGSGFGNPANLGWGLGWVCLGTSCGFAPPFPAGVCDVCGWAWLLACPPPFLAGVFGPAWLCARSACTPPFPARVCGVGVCAWARVSAALRHSWLRCWGVCLCLCARPAWFPAPPGWGCGAGVCAWAWVATAPRHSWPGCWGVCVFVCAPRLYPATPGWAVWCGVCAWARVSALPRHFWLGRWGVCVFVHVPRLYPAIPGALVCVCVGLGFVCSPVFSWLGSLGRMASCVRRVRFPSPSRGAAGGVGVCGSCRGWGLYPSLPFGFFSFGLRGVPCGFWPCRVMASWCPSLAIPV